MGLYYLHSGSDALRKKCRNLRRTFCRHGSSYICSPLRLFYLHSGSDIQREAKQVLQFRKDSRWDCIAYTAAATKARKVWYPASLMEGRDVLSSLACLDSFQRHPKPGRRSTFFKFSFSPSAWALQISAYDWTECQKHIVDPNMGSF